MNIKTLTIVTLVSLSCAGCQTIGDVTGLGGDRTKPETQTVLQDAQPVPILTPAPTRSGPLSGEQLKAAWGTPTLSRREANGVEMWTFGTPRASCRLIAFVYPQVGGALEVKRIEAAPGGADAAAVDGCVQVLGLSKLDLLR